MVGRLQNRVALISGTGGGQGRAAVLRFVAEGAKVVCCDINVARNEETVALGRAAGGDVVGFAPVDIADPAASAKWIADAAALHGRIDILYNNASVCRFSPVADISDEEWHFVMKNEIDVVFFPTRAAWPHLIKSRGVIINIGSVSGMVGWRGSPCLAHAAAKGAVIAMTRQLAVEGSPHGIRAVCISPGTILTPSTAPMMDDPQLKATVLEKSLVGRVGLPDDIAALAAFVASDDAGFITGANLMADGGHTSF